MLTSSPLKAVGDGRGQVVQDVGELVGQATRQLAGELVGVGRDRGDPLLPLADELLVDYPHTSSTHWTTLRIISPSMSCAVGEVGQHVEEVRPDRAERQVVAPRVADARRPPCASAALIGKPGGMSPSRRRFDRLSRGFHVHVPRRHLPPPSGQSFAAPGLGSVRTTAALVSPKTPSQDQIGCGLRFASDKFEPPEARYAETRGTRRQDRSRLVRQRGALPARDRVCATSGEAAESGPLRGRGRHHRAGAARLREGGGSVRSPLQRRPVSGHRAPANLRLLAKPTKRTSAESSVLGPVPRSTTTTSSSERFRKGCCE